MMTYEQPNHTDSSPQRLGLLLDQMQITDVLYHYGRAIDRCSVDQTDEAFALLARCLTDDVTIDYGVGGLHKGRENWVQIVKQTAPRMGHTLHLYTNVLVTVDGDQAHASCNVQATHVWEEAEGPRFLIAGGTFENDFRRTPTGWQMNHIVLNAFFNNDPTGKLGELFPAPPST